MEETGQLASLKQIFQLRCPEYTEIIDKQTFGRAIAGKDLPVLLHYQTLLLLVYLSVRDYTLRRANFQPWNVGHRAVQITQLSGIKFTSSPSRPGLHVIIDQ